MSRTYCARSSGEPSRLSLDAKLKRHSENQSAVLVSTINASSNDDSTEKLALVPGALSLYYSLILNILRYGCVLRRPLQKLPNTVSAAFG